MWNVWNLVLVTVFVKNHHGACASFRDFIKNSKVPIITVKDSLQWEEIFIE